MTTAERKYAGDSAHTRALRRRTALIDAALTEMAENRWRTATVEALCRAAKLNKRYFYESFDGLDALAGAVIESIATEVAEAAVGGYIPLLDQPVEEQARGAITAVVDILGDDSRKALVLLGGVPTTPAAHENRTAVIGGLTAALIAHARTTHDVSLEQDSLASTAPAFVIGGTAQTILSWATGDLPVTRDRLIEDITALWMTLERSATEMARSRLSGGEPH
ncbi:TetR/AcrR family transcriptional regulator [Nocardia testacea]|uniref:TetR/AcrR family transcriptional regulator n=1 Tax=Nocardia testacea TaxID=248551 RepID=UPI0002D9BA6C|nr:TetR/AcrR family transcriptional regulator [Nocardia testacea]